MLELQLRDASEEHERALGEERERAMNDHSGGVSPGTRLCQSQQSTRLLIPTLLFPAVIERDAVGPQVPGSGPRPGAQLALAHARGASS